MTAHEYEALQSLLTDVGSRIERVAPILPPAPREPEALTARHLLCAALNALREDDQLTLHGAIMVACLRTRPATRVTHEAHLELLGLRDRLGRPVFALGDSGVEVADLLQDFLQVSAPAAPAPRDTVRCAPPAEMATILGNEIEAA